MDHIGVEARREGAKLIIKKVLEMCGKEPAIVTGDFNVDQNNEAYHTMLQGGVMKDSYEAAAEKFATNGTFNSFNADLFTESRIDHIFVTNALEVTNYAVLTDGYWTPNSKPAPEIKGNAAPQEISFRKHIHRCPSDHYPIAARIVLKK
jgi:endonuclease/exonuclease/phosphatase family metal-dependent hydrolase